MDGNVVPGFGSQISKLVIAFRTILSVYLYCALT